MRVLVTGAAGFVGRHLLPRLGEAGYETIATDREVDVADEAVVEGCVARARPDAIVHLAAQSSVAASQRDAEATYRVNFLGARSVLEAAVRAAPRCRLLLVGSGEVYGNATPHAAPFREDAPLHPRSPYARTKACADLLGARYAQRGLDVVRARPFNHTGPGQSARFVASSFARQIAEISCGRREPELHVGNLDSVRDFLDVSDVIDAYARLLDPRVPAGVYNVASGRGRRIRELLDGLLELAGIRPRVEVDPERVRPPDGAVGDASRLARATGWRPRVPFTETLVRLLEDWRTRLSAA